MSAGCVCISIGYNLLPISRYVPTILQFVLIVYVCLLVDGVPVSLVAVGFLTHVCYGSLLANFPVISLFSPGFIGGTGGCGCRCG